MIRRNFFSACAAALVGAMGWRAVKADELAFGVVREDIPPPPPVKFGRWSHEPDPVLDMLTLEYGGKRFFVRGSKVCYDRQGNRILQLSTFAEDGQRKGLTARING